MWRAIVMLVAMASSTASAPIQGRSPVRPSTPAETLRIEFRHLSPADGLTLSISTPGDADGQTTFSNHACCGIESAQKFVTDVHIVASGRPLSVTHDVAGWSVRHPPRAMLTVSYRLPPSGPMTIDVGVPDQLRPIIDRGLFHVVGTFGLLMPVGRHDSDRLETDIDATRVADSAHFISSLGTGNSLERLQVTRAQVIGALYLGGPIQLSIHNTPTGKVAVVYSAMAPGFRANDFTGDALAIIAAERKFFNDGQPWYLVSLHGGLRKNPVINLGGGMGLTNSFVMFANAGLDGSDTQHREDFRRVLAHEYFHNWNGQTLRVASRADSKGDDPSVYWFSEGVTEFYTVRVLTRAGLMTSVRAKAMLNSKLDSYAKNSRRGVSASEAGPLFWTDVDGEQIPYLRGYLAAWSADVAIRRSSGQTRDLDSSIQALVARAKAEPRFRVDNDFLASYLSRGVAKQDGINLRRFIIDGGEALLNPSSFAPCLIGKINTHPSRAGLQFDFANESDKHCFLH